MADTLFDDYSRMMSTKVLPKNQKPIAAVVNLNQTKTGIKPSPEAVAKRAYFSYLNEGSIPGCDEKHWLGRNAIILGNGS
jgi:hypothetical protein